MMKQTTLTALLTVAVIALVIDRMVPHAEAEDAAPHILIAQVWMGNSWGTILSQEFTSRERCEAAAKVVSDMKGSQKAYCLPK